ncbi:MAG: DUF4197 domain-containing protein [Bacteroidota bacterium]
MNRILFTFSMVLSLCFFGCETLQQVAGSLPDGNPTNTEIIGGLKEALVKGAGFATTTLNQEGGYFKDPLVKIPFPQEAQFAANTLRDIGLGKLVDDFEMKLNEGAEKGAALALPIFKNAIKQMSFDDAKNILLGGENAATDYFKVKTTEQLVAAFSPQIKGTLDQVKATDIWSEITTRYNQIPFTGKKVETDLVKYTTGKALDGLFLKLGEEEKKIRENPIARTSDLLRKVFSFAERQATGNE